MNDVSTIFRASLLALFAFILSAATSPQNLCSWLTFAGVEFYQPKSLDEKLPDIEKGIFYKTNNGFGYMQKQNDRYTRKDPPYKYGGPLAKDVTKSILTEKGYWSASK